MSVVRVGNVLRLATKHSARVAVKEHVATPLSLNRSGVRFSSQNLIKEGLARVAAFEKDMMRCFAGKWRRASGSDR